MSSPVPIDDRRSDPVLWPHQGEAVGLVAKQLADGGRGQVVMACGTGKTRVGVEVARRLAPGGRVLVMAPTVLLLAQLLDAYRLGAGGDGAGRVLVVCGQGQAQVTARGVLYDLSRRAQVSTDPEVVAGVGEGPGRVTVLCTYASAPVLARAHREFGLGAWDVMIVDEAHRTVAGGTWGTVHDDARVPARRRVYMTATPRHITAHRNGEVEVAGMDDASVFGPVIYRLGFAAGIDLGLLAGYRLVVSVITRREVRALTDADTEDSLLRIGRTTVPARMAAAQIALARAARAFGLRRAVTYHSRVADARHFALTLPTVAGLLPGEDRPEQLWAGHVHGAQMAAQRDQQLNRLAAGAEDGLTVLANARLLSEGIDIPAVDAIVFCDPRRSTVDIVQAIGRALRTNGDPDKIATIIVPLLADEDTDLATWLDDSAFAPVWRVAQALRAHDEDLAADLDTRRRAHAQSDPPDQVLRAPDWLHIHGHIIPEGFAPAITIRLIHEATPSWQALYGAAIDYHHQHGHLDVPSTWETSTGLRLGHWLSRQRTRKKHGRLSSERIAALEDLGIAWSPLDAAWSQGLAAATTYHQRYGHLNVPEGHVTPDGVPLGQWIAVQRRRHNQRKLTHQRIAALENLGITWSPTDAAWNRALAAATIYHHQHGHLDIPSAYRTDNGFRLGKWLAGQRRAYRQHQLPSERVAALEDLDITWSPLDTAWNRGLAAATTYQQQHGHLDVPQHYVTPDGYKLGQWISQNRRTDLPADRVADLNTLGMIWNKRDATWQQKLAAITTYRAQHGHVNIHPGYHTPEGFHLGKWIRIQRNLHRQNRLPPDRAHALEQIGAV